MLGAGMIGPCTRLERELQILVLESPDGAELSGRVREVLCCLLDGLGEKEAASALGLSHHTIHVYVKLLYDRYHVQSRSELLAHIYTNALLRLSTRSADAGKEWLKRRPVGVSCTGERVLQVKAG
jgi:DNA-binding CsgD family transcriptional regulator